MQKLRFLVVDDAGFIRDLIKRTLKGQFTQCHIDEAINGKKAQSMLNRGTYDLILCDWEMPEMSGLEVLQWLRARETEQDKAACPFMMVTSRGDKSHVIKAVESGVSDYIGKPFSSEQLLKKVFKLLVVNHRDLIRAILKGSATMNPTSSGTGNDSASVLTAKPITPKTVSQPGLGDASVNLLTAGSPSSKLVGKAGEPNKRSASRSLGKVTLRSPRGQWQGILRDISLTDMAVTIDFSDLPPPAVLDQVVIDITAKNRSDEVARINTFTTSVQLQDKSLDCHKAQISIHVVDDDPVKLEILSHYVGQVR